MFGTGGVRVITSANLELGDQGIWFSRNRSEVSYPSSGNETCFEIEDHSFWFQHRNRCILSCMCAFPPAGAVFDVGGGNGYVSLGMQNCGFETVLLEPGLTGAQNARRRGLTNIICSTLEDAKFAAEALPAVGIFDVLEHIKDAHGFLAQLRGALNPNGRLYITVPTYRFLWSVDDDFGGHVRRYTRSSLIEDVSAAGFEVEYSTYFFAALPLPIFLTRTLPSRLGIRNTANSGGGAREHVSSETTGGVAQAIFGWEAGALVAKRLIPFGSSCLLVAKPKRERPQ
jgi:hypothetical protein